MACGVITLFSKGQEEDNHYNIKTSNVRLKEHSKRNYSDFLKFIVFDCDTFKATKITRHFEENYRNFLFYNDYHPVVISLH